jgi:diguanylate cyclase (GGDEF)-like protein/PAS domain S-box-containing protein
MLDEDKTKEQFMIELHELRQRLAESEKEITERKDIEAGLEKTRQELAVIKIAADEVSEYAESLIDTVREPLIALDQDLRVVTASRSFYEVFKVKPEETVGQLIYDLGNKQWDIPKLRELLETILPQKATFDDYEVEHDFASIGIRIMLLNARQIQRGLGKERIILLAIEDITARKEIEAGLEKTRRELEVIKKIADEASEYAESLINTVREPLISLNQDLRVVTVSRSFYEFFKVKPEETVGQLIYDLGNKQWDIPKLRELLETILPQKTTFDNYEVEHNFATIGRRVMLLNARQIQRVWGKERIILLAIEDITERKLVEEKVQHLAMYDSLTDLPNRNLFFNRLSQALPRADRFREITAMLYLDLDGFKAINDTLGHEAGDVILTETARRLRKCIRATDTAARLGGDEFAIILQDVREKQTIEIVAQRIVQSMSKPFDYHDHPCLLKGISIGISIYPSDTEDADDLVRMADEAMYAAKKLGRGGYLFYEAITPAT